MDNPPVQDLLCSEPAVFVRETHLSINSQGPRACFDISLDGSRYEYNHGLSFTGWCIAILAFTCSDHSRKLWVHEAPRGCCLWPWKTASSRAVNSLKRETGLKQWLKAPMSPSWIFWTWLRANKYDVFNISGILSLLFSQMPHEALERLLQRSWNGQHWLNWIKL